MRFLIAGATGLIGKRLLSVISDRKHELSILTTNKDLNKPNDYFNVFYWNPELGIIDENCVNGVDVIINLAGSPIAQLWTRNAKKSILESRVKSIELLNKAILNNKASSIKQFICASAIGLYKSDSNIIHNEKSKDFSNSFLADTVIKWENACDIFKSSNINVVKIRIGLVLSLKGGLLKPIVMSSKFFAGTWFGKGLNIYSWIHVSRSLTNLGLYRVYIEEFLDKNPSINSEMTLMCRQLTPTSQGVPLEIYAFSKDQDWKKYEDIMSDIFDHLLASLKTFHLELFELPSSLNNKANE